MQRLFFALWPDPELCEELLRRSDPWLRQTNGRPQPLENLHITLAFLGGVRETQRDCLEQQAAQIRIPPFQLNLDRLAFWPRPRVAWAGTNQTPEAFVQLAGNLQATAKVCELSIDKRPPVAHLTLKRKVTKAPPSAEIEALCWNVDCFYLVESKTYPEGAVYERLCKWSLR